MISLSYARCELGIKKTHGMYQGVDVRNCLVGWSHDLNEKSCSTSFMCKNLNYALKWSFLSWIVPSYNFKVLAREYLLTTFQITNGRSTKTGNLVSWCVAYTRTVALTGVWERRRMLSRRDTLFQCEVKIRYKMLQVIIIIINK